MCLDLAHGKPLLYRIETEQRTVGADSLPANIQMGRNATVRMSEHFVLRTVLQGGAESPSANIQTWHYVCIFYVLFFVPLALVWANLV